MRLYLFVFGRPQAHTLHRVRKTLCAVPVPQALQTGIPADKWDEYCSQVQENTQKEVEAQQARLEKAKALEEEEARTAKALAEYAELVRVQGRLYHSAKQLTKAQ